MLGNHMAKSGVSVLFSETTFNTSKENTKTKASAIPMARFAPSPPRFFWEDNESPKKVNMMTESGIEVL